MTRTILQLISMGRMDSLKQISAENALCNRWYCLNISKPFKTSLHLVIFCFLIVALRTQSATVKNIFLFLEKWLQLLKRTQPTAFDVLCNLLFMFSFTFGKRLFNLHWRRRCYSVRLSSLLWSSYKFSSSTEWYLLTASEHLLFWLTSI